MSISRFIVLLAAILLCCGCKNGIRHFSTDTLAEEDEFSMIDSSLFGKTLVVPFESFHKFDSRNESEHNVSDNSCRQNNLRLVIYVGSRGCTACRLKAFYVWDDFINMLDVNNIDFYFIVRPEKKETLRAMAEALDQTYFSHPVYLDADNAFMKANSFLPDKYTVTSFLIDRSGTILFDGDPISYYPEIKAISIDY